MKKRFFAIVGMLLFAAFGAAPADPPLHVLASNGVKAVIDELRPAAVRAVGRPLAIEYDTSSSVKKRIESGDAFEVAILTSDVIDDLANAGKISPANRTEIARCGIGVGVRAGAPKPDISTSDALKRTLLAAKSVTFAQDGASRVYILQMFDKLGITEAMKPKLVLEQGSNRANARVADGSAEMIMTLVSEILPAKGVQLVGPLPSDVQRYVNFAAGISAANKDANAAKRLMKFLSSSAAGPALKSMGMERPR